VYIFPKHRTGCDPQPEKPCPITGQEVSRILSLCVNQVVEEADLACPGRKKIGYYHDFTAIASLINERFGVKHE